MSLENKFKSNVKTYAEDMAKVIEGNEGGIIKKIIHEQEDKEAEKKNLSPNSRKNKVFIFSGTFLLFLALSLSLFFLFKQDIYILDIEQQFVPIIFTDQNVFKEVDGLKKEQIAESVWNETKVIKVKTGGVEGIYLSVNKKVIGLRKFTELISGNLVPNDFINDNFLFGVFNGQTKDLFILLKVRSFADAFPVMHAWEAKMFSNLYGFFGLDINSSTKYLLAKNFEDGTVQNKNARILYGETGEIVLMYVFVDDNSVVITNTENAVHEVILRLAGSTIEK